MAEQPSDFLRLLIALDRHLTGKETPLHQRMASRAASLETFLDGDRIFYLSDGGYSRIVWYLTSETLGLTRGEGGSRQAVIDRWDDPEAQHLRDQLEEMLRAANC